MSKLKKIVGLSIIHYSLSIFSGWAQPILTLDNAIKTSLQNSYDIQVAKNDAEIATISNSWALAGRLPTVSAGVGYTYSLTNLQQNLSNGTTTKRNGATNRNLNGNLSGNWVIFNGYRVVTVKHRLETVQEISEINLRQQSNQTVYEVITNYYNIARLQQQLSALKETISLFEERVKLSKARFEIGTAAKNDYLQSQVDLNDQRNTMMQIENDILAAKTALNNAMSRDPSLAFTVSDSVEAVTLPTRTLALENIDSLNPEILSAKRQEIVIMDLYKEIKSRLYPTVSLLAGANFVRSNNSAGFTLLNQTYGPQVGFGVTLPLFQGGIVRKQLQVNDIQLKTQKTQTENLRNDLQTTLVNAYNEYENAERQHALQQENLALIKENSFIAMERFRRAAITLVDLRQVQLSLVATQTNLINALYTMKMDQVALQYLTGSLAN
ncbi:MAG: TolC family protein [Chitinophagaceae bacterium]